MCFIPKGTTQEAYGPDGGGRLGTRGQRPDRHAKGPPHFTLGMHVEFTVVEGGAATTGSDAMTMTSMDMTPATTG